MRLRTAMLQTTCWTAFLCIAMPLSGLGATVAFDFDAGPGPNFQAFDSPPSGLWTLDTDGPTLRIAKPSDAGTINPNGFLNAGFRSVFTMDGDYEVTVDFTLHNFPSADGPGQLNESLLVVFPEGGGFFEVLRYRTSTEDNVESFFDPPGPTDGGPLGVQNSSLYTGQFRITRQGSIVTAFVAEAGSTVFSSLGGVDGFSGPTKVQLFGAQGFDGGTTRSTTALDISFDNLVVKADRFSGLVPEPNSLFLVALAGSGILLRNRRAKLVKMPQQSSTIPSGVTIHQGDAR